MKTTIGGQCASLCVYLAIQELIRLCDASCWTFTNCCRDSNKIELFIERLPPLYSVSLYTQTVPSCDNVLDVVLQEAMKVQNMSPKSKSTEICANYVLK